MKGAVWNGPDPKDKDACPYSIDFECKPAPARTLDSLESGRLMLTVRLKGNALAGRVDGVAAKLVNKAKEKNPGMHESALPKSQATASLRRNKSMWAGELSIPVSWTEGGTKSYERGGSWHPKNRGELFALEITYRLSDGSSCTARFGSEDAFHWAARPRASM